MEDGGASVTDVNNDGLKEIAVLDDVLNYWETGHAYSPFPRVIFSLQNGTYAVDTSLMRRKPPTESEISATIARLDGGFPHGLLCKIPEDGVGMQCDQAWGYMTDLIYSGNVESAKKYLEMAWTDNDKFKSKADFIDRYTEALKNGKYYQALTPFLRLEVLSSPD